MNEAPYLDGATFRRRWAEAERRVCSIDIESPHGLTGGTGFLVGPDLVMTSGHVVLPAGARGPVSARRIVVRFDYHRRDPRRRTHELSSPFEDRGESAILLVSDYLVAASPPSRHDAGDQGGFPADDELDYAILRLAEPIGSDGRGWYLLEDTEPPPPNTFLSVVQHPSLGPRSNAFEPRGVIGPNGNGTRLRHRVNTEGGSSGSPCFDASWNLVAVHQAGDPRAPLRGKAEFNQAIPIARIRRDLEAKDRWPLPSFEQVRGLRGTRSADPSRALVDAHLLDRADHSGTYGVGPLPKGGRPPAALAMVSPAATLPDPLQPTLILLAPPGEASQIRSELLIEEAKVPPEFVVRIGDDPPAAIGDNAVAVYLGRDDAPGDGELTAVTEELRKRRLEVIPVVESLDAFHRQVPEVLHPLNGVAWDQGGPPPSLRSRIRQLLGLEVDPQKRSVFISYSRQDSRHEVDALRKGLEARGFQVFVDLDDIQPGVDVQRVIERQFESRHALLYLETPNSWRSSWIKKELLWAHTRGLAIVVLQRGLVEHRHLSVGNLPLIYSDPRIPIADEAERLAGQLDRRIALASTRMVQLRGMVEAVIEAHPRASRVSLESLSGDTAIATFEMRVVRRTSYQKLYFQWSPHRPSSTLVEHLLEQHEALGVDGAVLLYEAPERPLEDEETEALEKQVAEHRIWWIERQKMESELGELIDHLTPGSQP